MVEGNAQATIRKLVGSPPVSPLRTPLSLSQYLMSSFRYCLRSTPPWHTLAHDLDSEYLRTPRPISGSCRMPSPKQSPVRGLHSPSAPATKRGASIRLRTLLILVSAVVFLGSASVYVAPRVAAGLMASWRPFAMGQAPAAAPTDGAWRTAAPFIFVSVQGFLKQWPNSYAPNGHSIVAGTLVPGTVLYHAKQSPGPPSKPTFFAFDA